MYQEIEKGLWKSVLGALGVASLFLTLVGNLAFSPKPSGVCRPTAANRERPLQAEQARPEFLATSGVTELARVREGGDELNSGELSYRQESLPHIAEQVPLPEQVPEAELVQVIQQAPLVELAPVAGQGPVVVQSSAAEQVTVAALPQKTDETSAILPVAGPLAPHETANDNTVAEVRPQPDVIPADNRDDVARTVAVADSPPFVVVPQKLSHHDRKMLRKMAHLEMKKNRLLKDGRSIVCR